MRDPYCTGAPACPCDGCHLERTLGTIEAVKAAAYGRGWKAAGRASCSTLDRADARGESQDWYAGYYDRAAGRDARVLA